MGFSCMVCDQCISSDGALLLICVLGKCGFLNLRHCLTLVDTDVQSYCNYTPLPVLSSAEHEKKSKYSLACRDGRATFTPLCCIY